MNLQSASRAILSIILYSMVALPVAAPAEEGEPAEAQQVQEEREEERRFFQKPLDMLEIFQAGFSKRLLSTSDRVDSFFGGDRIYEESRGSQARLFLGTTYEEGGGLSFNQGFRLKLSLRRTQDRLKLLVFGDDETDLANDEKEEDAKKVTGKEEDYANYAGLRFIPKRTRRYSLDSGIGARLQTPIEYYTKVRGRLSFFPGKWELRFRETVFWYKSKGFGEKTQIDFDRSLSEKLLFRAASDATWYNEDDELFLNHNFHLFQKLTDRNAMAYQAGVHGERRNSHINVTSYSLSVRFRRNFHKNWLFYEIQPGATYPREDDFHSSLYITFKIEMLFGKI